ncbi:MAG: preprotein translocase subunit YajC [Flavobacteriales bacterium]
MNQFLLQAAPAASSGGGSSMSIIFMIGFFAIFYFFMIRPQMKRAKEQKKFQEGVKIGDKVVTLGGIHGKVIEVGETDMVISIDQGRMRIEKSAISADRTVKEQAQ